MKIDFIKNAENLEVKLEGRLDTTTAPEFDSFLNENLGGVSALTIDCKDLTYVSSAGLRVLLAAHKQLKGAMTLKNVCEIVMEVFEMTGFVEVLEIE